MREIETVVLLDAREIIARKGVDVDVNCFEAAYEIHGHDLRKLSELFDLRFPNSLRETTVSIWPGDYTKCYPPLSIMGEIVDGVLNLRLEREDYYEHRSYKGMFDVYWTNEPKAL